MSKDIREQLKRLQGHTDMCPRSDWVKQNRSALLRAISTKTDSPQEQASSWIFTLQRMHAVFLPQRFALVARVFVVGIVSIGMAMGGWMVSVSASSKSLPSDHIRYGVKLATEKTQVIVAAATGDNESEATLHLAFAERRADELKQLSNDPVSVDKTAKRLKESITSAEEKLKDLKEKEPEKVQDIAKQITEKTTNIAKDLKDTAKNIVHEDIGATEQAVKEVQNAKKAVTDAGIGAIQTLVETQTISDEEVKELVQKKLEVIISDTEEVKHTVDEVADSVENLAVDTTTTVAIGSTTIKVSASTTEKRVDQNIITTNTLVSAESTEVPPLTLKQTVQKVGETVEKTEEVVQEAKQLLEGNNVQGALEKVKLLSELTLETEENVVQVEKTIKETKDVVGATPPLSQSTVIDGTASSTGNQLLQ